MNLPFKKAYTLIEVLICLAIIAILSAIAITEYSRFIDKVRGLW